MRAAIYSRVSTDEQRDALTAQELGARAWCDRNGHVVVVTYSDENVSGAEWVNRPGLRSMLEDAKREPRPWDVLLVRDLDRLGRDVLRLGLAIETLHDHGARCIAWSTNEEVNPDPTARMMLLFKGIIAEQERAQIAHRVRTSLRQKAERGLVVGGECYGYTHDRRADGVHFVVNEPQAAVLREIFARSAAGEGLRQIAHLLNARGIPAPQVGKRGTGFWTSGGLNQILHRDRYVGVLRWGARGSKYRQGTKVATRGTDVVEVRDESLRIIDDATWRTVRSRDDAARRASDCSLVRRRARHLLVGFTVCDACGGPVSTGRTKVGKRVVTSYVCGWRRDRGTCTATWNRPAERLNALVLDWLTNEVLTDAVLDDVVAEAKQLADAPTDDRVAVALRDEERSLSATIGRLMVALETASDVPELAARLRSQSERLREVRAALSATVAPPPVGDLESRLRAGASRLREMLAGDLSGARDVLEIMLAGRLRIRWDGPRKPVWISGFAVPHRIVTLGSPSSQVCTVQTQRHVPLLKSA